jgi:predicted nucleic acid-binding protein
VGERILVDTSVAVALLVEDHEHHAWTHEALRGFELGLAGHAFFETLSVVTRLPGVHRRSVNRVYEALSMSFPGTVFLSAEAGAAAAKRIAHQGIAGGSVYDALVAAAAVEHEYVLATRDQRALATYSAMGVSVRVIASRRAEI